MGDIFDLFRQIETGNGGNTQGNVSFLICGLGNPGTEYQATRHNIGFAELDAIASHYGIRVDRAKFHALIGEGTIGGRRVLLMKPQTYMNNSGVAVGEAASFYKLTPEQVLVLSDDITLAPGRFRFRQKGSAGGHNGLKSIIEHLGGDTFPRLRFGVGEKPSPDYDLADWVLGKLSLSDRDLIAARCDTVYAGVEAVLGGDYDLAARLCNGKV